MCTNTRDHRTNVFDPDAKTRLRELLANHEQPEASRKNASAKPTPLLDSTCEYPVPSVDQFLDDDYYLGTIHAPKDQPTVGLYDYWRQHLRFALDPKNGVVEILVEASVGAGKSTFACTGLLFDICKNLCLVDPQLHYGLQRFTPIVYFVFNVTLNRVENVCYKTLINMVRSSPFFRDRLRSTRARNEITFQKNISIEFGSQATHALGAAIKGALLDEANFGQARSPEHQETQGQVLKAYNTVLRRAESRFMKDGVVNAQVFMISSPQAQNDALHQHIVQAREQNISSTYIIEAPIYEVKSYLRGKSTGLYSTQTFGVLVGDRFADSHILDPGEVPLPGYRVLEVPIDFRGSFQKDIETSLRDICSISLDSTCKLIRQRDRLRLCVDPGRRSPFKVETVFLDFDNDDQISDFVDIGFFKTYLETCSYADFALHVDGATSHDSLGIALCHLADPERTSMDHPPGTDPEQARPLFVNDLVIGVKNLPGKEIPLQKIVGFILWLRDCMGVNIVNVSCDSHQYAALLQPLMTNGLQTQIISADRNDRAYITLRTLIYDACLSLYTHELLLKEICDLNHFPSTGKVNHPVGGSKDLSDALAGSLFWLAETEGKRGQANGRPIFFPSLADIRREVRKRERLEWQDEWGWIIDS
jgi:hypothetical protein